MKEIKANKNVLTFADKTTNLYELSKDQYEKILTENITNSYKKSTEDVKLPINNEAKKISEEIGLANKMQTFTEKDAYMTLKATKRTLRTVQIVD